MIRIAPLFWGSSVLTALLGYNAAYAHPTSTGDHRWATHANGQLDLGPNQTTWCGGSANAYEDKARAVITLSDHEIDFADGTHFRTTFIKDVPNVPTFEPNEPPVPGEMFKIDNPSDGPIPDTWFTITLAPPSGPVSELDFYEFTEKKMPSIADYDTASWSWYTPCGNR